MALESANTSHYPFAKARVKQILRFLLVLIPILISSHHANFQRKLASARTADKRLVIFRDGLAKGFSPCSTPRNRCAHPGACGNFFRHRNARVDGLSKSVVENNAIARGPASAKRENATYTLPPASWPTPHETAKKLGKSTKALGHRPMAKRPLGQAGVCAA